VSAISTKSQITRARAAAGAVINPGDDAAGAGDRTTRLAAVEAAVATAAERCGAAHRDGAADGASWMIA
jgi:hypothetical protein